MPQVHVEGVHELRRRRRVVSRERFGERPHIVDDAPRQRAHRDVDGEFPHREHRLTAACRPDTQRDPQALRTGAQSVAEDRGKSRSRVQIIGDTSLSDDNRHARRALRGRSHRVSHQSDRIAATGFSENAFLMFFFAAFAFIAALAFALYARNYRMQDNYREAGVAA